MKILNPLLKLNLLLLSLNPFEFTALSIILGYIFTDGLNVDQIESLGNFFESLGQTMITIGTQMQSLDDSSNNQNYDQAISILKNKINNIEDIIAKIKSLEL